MKDIVFVNPPASLHDRYGTLSHAGSTLPSLGLAFLAAASRKNGFEPAIIEGAELTNRQIVHAIRGYGARFAGITATTGSIHRAAALAASIKEELPGVCTIIGGPHLTALPEDTLRRFSAFDVGIIGEGEESLADFLKTSDANGPFSDVKGIVVRNNGSLMRTSPRPHISELDELALPAWDLIPDFPGGYIPAAIRVKHLPAGHIVTSRGCPMKCTFCDRSVFGKQYRLFSIEYIWEMLCVLTNTFKVRDVLFEDDSFTLHRTRVLELCEIICRHSPGFSWSCLGRVDAIDKEMLTMMKRAGCWQIGFGIESGSKAILDTAEKRIDLDRIQETLKMTRTAGIRTKGFFILGLPLETEVTMKETIRFALSAPLDDISVSFATPFPGTEFNGHAAQYGSFAPDFEKMNLLNAVFVPHGLTSGLMESYHWAFIKRFYLRLRVMADYLMRGAGDVKVFFRLCRSFCEIVVKGICVRGSRKLT